MVFVWRLLNSIVLFGVVMLTSCGSSSKTVPPAVEPYDICAQGDSCANDQVCMPTSLPASSGYTGSLCTSACSSDLDCLVTGFYLQACFSGECYITCTPGAGPFCPYGQRCVIYDRANLGDVELCTP